MLILVCCIILVWILSCQLPFINSPGVEGWFDLMFMVKYYYYSLGLVEGAGGVT